MTQLASFAGISALGRRRLAMSSQEEESLAKAPTESGRIATIDALKGVAVLLVVFGHAIMRAFPDDYSTNWVFRLVYSFHMPLFMMLSGYVVGIRRAGHGLRWVARRAAVLVVPFLAWIPIYCIGTRYWFTGLTPAFDGTVGLPRFFFNSAVMTETQVLWYLWVLFLNCCLLALSTGLAKTLKRVPVAVSLAGVWLILFALPIRDGLLGFGRLKWFFPFFALGVLVRRHPISATKVSRVAARVVALTAFPAISYIWLTRPLPLEPAKALTRAAFVCYFPKAMWALAGIALTWACVDLASRFMRLRLAQFLGVLSFELYVTHLLFLRVGIGSGWVWILTVTIFATTLALGVSFVLDRVTLTRDVLLGRWFSGDPFARYLGKAGPAQR